MLIKGLIVSSFTHEDSVARLNALLDACTAFSNLGKNSLRIEVDGEEDLAALPAILLAPRDVAQMLTRLEIYPIEIGMSLHAVFEDGNLFKPDVLDIDIDEFMLKLRQASSNAFNLATESSWVNELTIKPLINKAML